jgi:hypothetical protein
LRRLAVLALAGSLAVPAAASASRYSDAVDADRPSSYWRFSETSGGVARDSTGRRDLETHVSSPTDVWGRTGALAGDPDPSLWLPGTSVYPTRTALYGNSYDLSFNGRNPFTLEAWIRPERLNAQTLRVFSSEDRHTTTGTLLGVRSDGIVFSRFAANRWNTVKAPAVKDRWQHVVATYDGTTMRLYVDGQLRASAASVHPNPLYFVWFIIGAKENEWLFYGGGIDEAAVYMHALSPQRVAAHYEIGSRP